MGRGGKGKGEVKGRGMLCSARDCGRQAGQSRERGGEKKREGERERRPSSGVGGTQWRVQ